MSTYPDILTPPMDSPEFLIFSPGSESSLSPPPAAYEFLNFTNSLTEHSKHDYTSFLQILENPVEKFRFRYKSEMSGTHGCLTGQNSDRSRKHTYPSVRLLNFDRPAIIRCSLYQICRPEPHAHRLVKKVGFEETDDPHDLEVSPDTRSTATFINMGIIHTAKKYIVGELIRKYSILKREAIARQDGMIRQFTAGEEIQIKKKAESEANHINLNQVCLRFDAFEKVGNALIPIAAPVYSTFINNLKSALTGELKIVRMDHCTSSCRGGQEIFILVEKVAKKNIKVRFFELDDEDNEIWSDYGKFSDLDVHHQYAIVFKTPPYKRLDIDRPVKVYIELVRPTDNNTSESKDFAYTPCDTIQTRKRARSSYSSYSGSNFSSKDLPTILPLPVTTMPINSKDLNEALENNHIDSEEFQKLCEQLLLGTGDGIEKLYIEENITMDTPSIKNDANAKSSNIKEDIIIGRIESEIRSFLCATRSYSTTPKRRLQLMLASILNQPKYKFENDNNVIHHLISRNAMHQELLMSLLRLLQKYELSTIANIRNKLGQTALHLAVSVQNKKAVQFLMGAKTDLSIQDLQGNTVVHCSIMREVSIDILKLLFISDKKQTFMDLKNNEGSTALHLAVKTNNLEVTRLLCNNNANINMASDTNGYTPLHMAVADTHKNIVEFLLEQDCDTTLCDFNDSSALKLAKVLIDPDRHGSMEIYKILERHMKKHGLFENNLVKEEDDEPDSSDSDTMEIIKTESGLVPEDLLFSKYKKMSHLPEICVQKISDLLNVHDIWTKLAESLDYGHMVRADIFKNDANPAKSFLDFVMANGENLLRIRQSLYTLSQTKALEILDSVVKEEPFES